MRVAALALVVALPPAAAQADVAPACHVVKLQLMPATDDLQIVAWVARPGASSLEVGQYVGTAYITQATGRFGLGNRPGRFDFNSGPPVHDQWPYGRRTTTFPVWSHANGLTFPLVVFQDGNEDNISHQFVESSNEKHYCRPRMVGEPGWDTGTCASAIVYTDKGTFAASGTTGYPPRADVEPIENLDSKSATMFAELNPFDTVSQATPPAGTIADLAWRVPADLPAGDYVLWVEVSRGFDFNDTYNASRYPAPMNIPYAEYGIPYRGQPSVVYQVPFAIDPTRHDTPSTLDYAGYGDPDGASGTIHAPDPTITTDTPGSGASRLQILPGTQPARIRVDSYDEHDVITPAAPGEAIASDVAQDQVTVTFRAPGDDGLAGKISGYEIRYRALSEITDDNFATASVAAISVPPAEPGTLQTATLKGLLPSTDYSIGIRAYDDCHNTSPLAVVQVTTLDRESGTVDACFVATAAYGSLLANQVEPLRHFRDAVLRRTVLGELAVETYYTFGPSLAGVIAPSELLRATMRDVLAPIIFLLS